MGKIRVRILCRLVEDGQEWHKGDEVDMESTRARSLGNAVKILGDDVPGENRGSDESVSVRTGKKSSKRALKSDRNRAIQQESETRLE